jgi:PAS domain S-box-containing protein
MRDVRKQSAALRESEHHWREVFEQSPTMYFLIDAGGTVLSVNAFGASQLGYAVGELVGQPVDAVFLPADREPLKHNLALCVDDPGRSTVWEARKVRKDGAVRWVRETAKFVQWGANDPIFLVSGEDITQRKEAEEAVRRSEACLQEAQRLGRIGSWSHDVASDVMTVSPELFRIFGRDPAKNDLTRDIMGRSIHPDDRDQVVRAIEAGRASMGDIEVEHRIVLPDGGVKHVHGVSHPVVDERGALVEYIGTIMDVTERKQADEALRQAFADLARVSRITIMGELTASLAHEVNQPITAAVTNANACLRFLAGESPDLEAAREAAAAIVQAGVRAAEIISRTRRIFEKGALQREPIEVDSVIRETVLILNGEASRAGVSIRTGLAADFPEVLGDRVQLQQVLMNLILNGIDALKAAEGTREITIGSQRTGEDEIMVSVSDTGIGLPADHADHLFETFYTTKPHGTGMGLSISRSIIAAHDGRLWAEPNEPRGAVFRFTLPTGPEDAAALADADLRSAQN